MSYQFEVEFSVRKGLGPGYYIKFVSIGYDDVEPDVPESVVKDWAKADAERYLKTHDCPAFIYRGIHHS